MKGLICCQTQTSVDQLLIPTCRIISRLGSYNTSMKFTYDSVFGIIWSIIYGNIMLSCFQVYNQSCSKMSSVKAMDEGGPKKSFPSEPLITLQYETSLYSDTSWAYEINSSKLPFLSSCAHPYPSSMALTILSLSNTPITVS